MLVFAFLIFSAVLFFWIYHLHLLEERHDLRLLFERRSFKTRLKLDKLEQRLNQLSLEKIDPPNVKTP